MKVEVIRYPTAEDWAHVKAVALETEGKTATAPPSEEWKVRMLRARHSPIRELMFHFRLTDVPYWVTVHLCRHVHALPYVSSQRNDRQTKYDRNKAPQDAPVTMRWTVNAEELITIANKRLCGKASKETRQLVRMICDAVIELCPEFKTELVPMCVRNGGFCYEMKPCKTYEEPTVPALLTRLRDAEARVKELEAELADERFRHDRQIDWYLAIERRRGWDERAWQKGPEIH